MIKKAIFSRKNLGRDFVIISLFSLLLASATRAGNLDSSGSPAATGYTLADIYTRLATNVAATEGDHSFSPSADPASSGYTLSQIYSSIPTILPETVKSGTDYLGVSGTLTPDGGTATVADFFNGKTAHLTADWNLDTGTLNLACNTATFDGTNNLVADAYDGSGNGNNRWCMTNSGDAAAADILSGKTAWADGVEIAGSMNDAGQQTITPGTANQAITEGYHDGTGYCAGDADLAESNIASGVTIFGVPGSATVFDYGDDDAAKVGATATVPGTLLADQFNGSATSGATDYAFWTQALGGVDDYNDGGSIPGDAYAKSWTQCDSGNQYCDTEDSDACGGDVCWRDDSTGMIWSDYLNGGTDRTWFWANNCFDPETAENPGTCVSDGDDACQCVKKTSSKTGCNALGDGNWRLPYQKELMQAYIDGSWGSGMPHAGSYWSATTYSYTTYRAWYTSLYLGLTSTYTKTSTRDSRCVYSFGN